ncbi:hypothetical protein BDK51DRAFT_42506 [Blyttiomyces helicus]|uniref:Uncharacterized protein n=1 Tax=Blyttiomyces helicus TaxID=388810 RepID=A0A4P9VYK2_9FUNG|nr:hypothetical protein BDK51DRAFT_42506 [Blyttiomyces helicus]|eukprot:RKO84869.1 hypothetical protein BDK51DRAFT_42506 [Blyttiomyces helicus]
MRPDPHKSKATRKWKAKQAGGGPAPSDASPAAGRGGRGGRGGAPRSGPGRARDPPQQAEAVEETEDDEEAGIGEEGETRLFRHSPEPESPSTSHKLERSQFSRRKIETNVGRYHEPTAEEIMAAEADIDRETEDLLALIKDAEEDYDPSLYFQFREEREWTSEVQPNERDESDDRPFIAAPSSFVFSNEGVPRPTPGRSIHARDGALEAADARSAGNSRVRSSW